MTVLDFVRLPLLFMSGVFVPRSEMPGWARAISKVSPLTYANDLTRRSTGMEGDYSWWLDVLVLLAFTVAFFSLAVWIF